VTGLRETSVWFAINGARRFTLACSAHELDALALGHLRAEGWIDSAADVIHLDVVDGPGGATGVALTIDAAREAAALQLREHRLHHGCGLRHELDCVAPPVAATSAPAVAATALFRSLFTAADAASPAGGIHAAALSDGVNLLHTAHDVARHSAVDRAIGLGVRADAALDRLGLVLTARVSGAIALKCARAGMGWIASRSVATTLAHEIGAAFGVTIIERAPRAARGR
jgi:FdhD protein